jgi:hypothetical protein
VDFVGCFSNVVSKIEILILHQSTQVLYSKSLAIVSDPNGIRTRVTEMNLIPNSLHVLQEYLLAAAVIEFCGPAIDVARDSLSGFKGTVILQTIRDAGRPGRVRRMARR